MPSLSVLVDVTLVVSPDSVCVKDAVGATLVGNGPSGVAVSWCLDRVHVEGRSEVAV